MSKTKFFSKAIAVVLAIMLCLTAFIAAPVSAETTTPTATYSITFTDTDHTDGSVQAKVSITSDTACLQMAQVKLDYSLTPTAVASDANDVLDYLETAKTVFVSTKDNGNATELSFTVTFDVSSVSSDYYTVSIVSVEAIMNTDEADGSYVGEGDVTAVAGTASATVAVGDPSYSCKGMTSAAKFFEPWGIQFTSYVSSTLGDKTEDMDSNALKGFADYGAYVLVRDPAGDEIDASTLTTDAVKAGTKYDKTRAEVVTGANGTGIRVTVDEEVYTYQMKEKYIYILFYVKETADSEEILFTDTASTENIFQKQRSLYNTLETMNNNSGKYDAEVNTLVDNMIALYNSTIAYREYALS